MQADTIEKYLNNSVSAYNAIERALFCMEKNPAEVRTILDFGSGYGRVLRSLRAAHPDAEITATDLMTEAVDFCATQFGAKALYGTTNLDEFIINEKFDLIWVGSVFTHYPQDGFDKLLQFLAGCLAPDGLLVFTTHGRCALWVFKYHTLQKSHINQEQFNRMLDEFNAHGYGYIEYSPGLIRHIVENQGAKISQGSYGLACARPDWVFGAIAKVPFLTLNSYQEGGWGKNHDVVSVIAPTDLRIP